MTLFDLLFAASVAALTSAILTPVARAIARRLEMLDEPNARSSHTIPTPRTGGWAIVAGILAGAITADVFRDRALLTAGVGALALLAVAAIDEVRSLPRKGRFAAQLVVGGFVSVAFLRPDLSLPGSWLPIALAIFWTVWMTNAYNFMDGINGIAASTAVVAASVLAVMFWQRGDETAAALALAMAAAAAGFLPWNMTGTIFMGDVGSATLGFLFACLVLRASGDNMLLPAILPLVPFLFDATVTLLIRAARGEAFFSTPHRSHCYQRLVQRGWSHASVTALWSGLASASSAVALAWASLETWSRMICLAALVALHVWVFALSRRNPATARVVSSDSAG